MGIELGRVRALMPVKHTCRINKAIDEIYTLLHACVCTFSIIGSGFFDQSRILLGQINIFLSRDSFVCFKGRVIERLFMGRENLPSSG